MSRETTTKDCKKGFHKPVKKGETKDYLYEKCLICNKTFSYLKKKMNDEAVKNKLRENYKLDILQPRGHQAKDFDNYYPNTFKK